MDRDKDLFAIDFLIWVDFNLVSNLFYLSFSDNSIAMKLINKHSNITRYKIDLTVLTLLLLSGLIFSFSPEETRYISPEFICAMDDQLIISDVTGERIMFLNAVDQEIVRTRELTGKPGRVSLSEDGRQILVPISEVQGKLAVLGSGSGELISEIEIGHTPVAVVVAGHNAFVLNKFSNDVSVVDLLGSREVSRIPVIREPVAAVLSKDGQYLFVANSLPNMRGSADRIAAGISIINTRNLTKEKDILLPNGSTGVKDICISHDGKFAYITHVLGRYNLITSQIERGWINTNALSIIDIENQGYYNTVLLDDVDQGAANPWGVSCSDNGERIFVALAGTHELCIIDRIGMHTKLEDIEKGIVKTSIVQGPGDVVNDFSFLSGLKKRIQTGGSGPRGIEAIDGKVFISEYFSGTIAAFDQSGKLYSISLGTQAELTGERTGESHFHDARLCFQQWQSCTSCHPDARTDGLSWDLLNDGIGNPKNTKSLVLSHATPPVMITGIRPDAETAVRAGIKYIQFVQRPEEDAAAIDAYLKSLEPLSSPRLLNGQLSQAAVRGKRVFMEAECDNCHGGIYFTNMKQYDVGTGKGNEENTRFDTPSLKEAWRNSPYLYDGRALTLKKFRFVPGRRQSPSLPRRIGNIFPD